jgi:effector-binding domain-containing protein
MQRIALIIIIIMLSSITGGCAIATAEVKYKVVIKAKDFELRDYPAHVVAETVVDGTLEDAGNKAFSRLFGYISGNNRSRDKIAMTAPVSQKPASEKIAMTAPVGQQRAEEGWVVSFTMPVSYTLETLPVPEDPEVKLRQVPARRMASVQYSGTWSESRYLRYRQDLESWIEKNGFRVQGEPVWARYNSPFTPWFLRRNEILIPVDSQEKQDNGSIGGEMPRSRDDHYYGQSGTLLRIQNAPCVIDVFMSAVHFMEGGEPLPWWSFIQERKNHIAQQKR